MARKLTDAEKKQREKEKKLKEQEKKKHIAEVRKQNKELAEYKSKYRASKEWKDWRRQVLEAHDYTCQICGKKYASKTLVCHHKFIALHSEMNTNNGHDYAQRNNLDDFACVCSKCHKFIHYIGTKYSEASNVIEVIKNAIESALGSEWTHLKD